MIAARLLCSTVMLYCFSICNAFEASSVRQRLPTQLWIVPQQLGSFEVLELPELPSSRQVSLLDFSTVSIPFATAWEWQKSLLDEHIDRISQKDVKCQFMRERSDILGLDAVIMLQHLPVYTLGTGSDEKFVLSNDKHVPIVRMDRGGEVTYHGPGQLTVYPVFDLRGYQQDIHWYMRALEEAILIALSKCGLNQAERKEDVTGVWVDDCKVAACGIKCRRWITQHGLAVNVEEKSLSNFAGIVPCGLDGRKVGCINQFLDEPITVVAFAELMKEALEEVFQIELLRMDRNIELKTAYDQ